MPDIQPDPPSDPYASLAGRRLPDAENIQRLLKALAPDYMQEPHGTGQHFQTPNPQSGKLPSLEPYNPMEAGAMGALDVASALGPMGGAKVLATGLLSAGAKAAKPLLTEEAIAKALAKNPGASIADIGLGTYKDALHPKLPDADSTVVHLTPAAEALHAKDPSKSMADWHKLIVNDPYATNYAINRGYTPNKFNQQGITEITDKQMPKGATYPVGWTGKPTQEYPTASLENLPHEAQWRIPERAKQLGFNVPAHHGTRTDQIFNQFRLPHEEIGVHFGTPQAAQDIQGAGLDNYTKPRVYPVALQAQKPLRLPDLGSWQPDKIANSLVKDAGFPKGEVEAARFQGLHHKKQYEDADVQAKNLRKYLSDKGHDSIVYRNDTEDPGHDSHILFKESPTQPGYVTGARVPWAAFDPRYLQDPNILRGLAGAGAGGAAATPQIQELITSLKK